MSGVKMNPIIMWLPGYNPLKVSYCYLNTIMTLVNPSGGCIEPVYRW
jgi:hypothetical protein